MHEEATGRDSKPKRPHAYPEEYHLTPARDRHIPGLDGVRGLAILAVIVFNTLGATSQIASVGWMGVDLFFVLSGFLITGILIDARAGDGYFRTFYARRVLNPSSRTSPSSSSPGKSSDCLVAPVSDTRGFRQATRSKSPHASSNRCAPYRCWSGHRQ